MSHKMKKILVTLTLVWILSVMTASVAIAYAGGVRGVGLVGVCFFFTSGVMIIMAQLIPAGILLASFIGTAVTPFRKNERLVQVT